MSDLIAASLSEVEEDLNDPVYERFFAASESGRELMGHADEYMRGRMLQQVFELLLTDSEDMEDYLAWEVDNHVAAYGVNADMYADFFQALYEAVRASLGDAWTPVYDKAWQTRIGNLLTRIADAERQLER